MHALQRGQHACFTVGLRHAGIAQRFGQRLTHGKTWIERIERITGSKQTNIAALCLGGTLALILLAYMAARGFRVYDVCTFFRRPYDNALWQMDMVFVKATSPLMASTRWA